MEAQFSEEEVLVNLGLTLKQARIYLALSTHGSLKVSEISKIAKVARSDVYKVISKLQKISIVEKILKAPLEYRATPLKHGLSSLLERKKARFEKVQTETEILLNTIELRKQQNKLEESIDPQLVLIPQGKTIIEKIGKSIENAESTIDLLLSFKRFSRGIVSTFSESMETAWAKNVRTRFLLEMPSETKTSKKLVQFCRKKPSCEVRFIRNFPRTIFGIYDKREMFLITNPKTDLPGSSALWTTNSSFIALAEDNFNCLWSTAQKPI